MIIVSQDKKSIVIIDNVTTIWIENPEENDSEKFSIETSAEVDKCLGYYETEERAKEILKEIVQCYANTEQYKSVSNTASADFLNDLLKNAIIYAMPEK